MAAYPAEVQTPAPTDQPVLAVPRQRGAALGLAAMAVGASSVIGLAGPAMAAEHAEHGGATGSLFVDEHAGAASTAHASDAGTALLDRIRTQGAPDHSAAAPAAPTTAQSVRLEAAAAASAKAAAAERVRAVGPLVPPIACASTGLGRDASYWSHLHPGQDFPAPAGTPVRAVGAGAVTSAGWAGSYGYRVVQTLPDGTEIWYCHLSAIAATAGSVQAGHPLGRVGSSRGFTTPHVYIEVRPDGADPVDPSAWFAAHGLSI
ncbi:M23 family metallopeptidase [Streptacidiphilus neutrinimicus]|uniref:M23 family metallopeptidase n=1 Tax=Streptacidiphilus neutrinimicus TaxID=105420 RepID=UPI0006948F20|nr:M23 family metallopeptidase [Streptacidiphilus neutrinimicus]